MFKLSEHIVTIVTLLIVILAVAASAFYEQRVNSVPLPSDGVSLVRWPYDNAVLPEESVPISTPPMPPPVAYFSTSPEAAFEGMLITFDASVSYDPFGPIASYEWDFGDGSKGEGKTVTHSYSSSGKYEAKLTVTGTLEIASSISKQITVEQRAKGDVLDDMSLLKFQHNALPLNAEAMAAEHDALLQNFPNPFNPETWIPYHLKEGREVIIRIYAAEGGLVKQLDLGYKPAGLYTDQSRAAYWNGRNSSGEEVASGVYFYSIHAGDFHAVRKLTVLR